MDSISLQPGVVVICGGAEFVPLTWFWGILGLFLGAFCCWFGSAFRWQFWAIFAAVLPRILGLC